MLKSPNDKRVAFVARFSSLLSSSSSISWSASIRSSFSCDRSLLSCSDWWWSLCSWICTWSVGDKWLWWWWWFVSISPPPSLFSFVSCEWLWTPSTYKNSSNNYLTAAAPLALYAILHRRPSLRQLMQRTLATNDVSMDRVTVEEIERRSAIEDRWSLSIRDRILMLKDKW